ncbi:MAG TPA: heparinase II/III family protein [Opitutaceae bacterium]|nr:heparinase II/III family protein [Opitutaceae bacterium]
MISLPRIPRPAILLGLLSLCLLTAPAGAAAAVDTHVPARAPRTQLLPGRVEAFRTYVTTGAGAAAFARIREDFDRDYLKLPFPSEPLTYGDPNPRARDSEKADRWREAQDVCGVVSGVAEAAALIWIVTGETRYLEKARQFLVASTNWSLDGSGWPKGPSPGATDIRYNDEAHFRLWRKLPLVYDQIRDQLTPAEKQKVLAHLRERGRRSFAWIEQEGRISTVLRNSLKVTPSSHPIRFMPMTGLSALALWDDLPESREWWAYTYTFYRDQFPPWGGDDGGWAEGPAYWRGNIEHAAFQDTLLAIGDPSAYRSAFWKNHGYFQIYNVQPYLASGFGDFSNAGKFNLEPVVAEYLTHLARVTQDGHLLSFAALCSDDRPSPAEKGLRGLDRIYPTSAEFLIRNFLASALPLPAPQPLARLPQDRFFRDIGWVSLHSALGRPDDDIHLTFVSSPYGSYSHSHAHQNAFVLNAYGQNLAIASGYREFHNSPHHDKWTRQTVSKNALLIDGLGQKPQDKNATGKITRFETQERAVWTTGDATVAYQANQAKGYVERVTRDLVFIDRRYVVLRDVVKLARPGRVSFLLHGERPLEWSKSVQTAVIRASKATLTARLVPANGIPWEATLTNTFPVPVDPKYVKGAAANYSSSAPWGEQGHFSASSPTGSREHVLYTVLWPERGGQLAPIDATFTQGTLIFRRPDGATDAITLTDEALRVERR